MVFSPPRRVQNCGSRSFSHILPKKLSSRQTIDITELLLCDPNEILLVKPFA